MRIACLGGGPAGLYFAISMKLRDPAHDIDLYERNRPDDTFGWGVVFSDQTVENLMANDPVSGAVIRDEFAHWDDIDVHIHGETVRSSGHGFIGIGRKRLDRKSTRLNSSHANISYAVFCLKKKKQARGHRHGGARCYGGECAGPIVIRVRMGGRLVRWEAPYALALRGGGGRR